MISNSDIISDMLGNKKWTIPVLIAFAGLIISIIRIYLHRLNEYNKRIDKVVNNFMSKFHNGYFLDPLLPSGISNLKNNKEIEIALNKIKNSIGCHPLRQRNESIKKIGYKKFFLAVSNSGQKLSKHSIDNFIKQLSAKS